MFPHVFKTFDLFVFTFYFYFLFRQNFQQMWQIYVLPNFSLSLFSSSFPMSSVALVLIYFFSFIFLFFMSYFSSLPMTSGFLYFFFFRGFYCVLLSLSLPFPQTLTNLLLSPFFLVEFYTPILFLFLHFSFVVVTYSTPRSKLLWRVGILSPKCTISWQCTSFDFYFFLTHFFLFSSLSFPHFRITQRFGKL